MEDGKIGPAVDRRYTEGELVTVALVRNQAEAEFVQALLMEQGIPSILKRTRGFDVPDFLAAGPRDVMVTKSAESVAREMLLQAGLRGSGDPERVGEGHSIDGSSVKGPAVVALGVLVLGALSALFVWLFG